MVREAVILGAGLGSRLKGRTAAMPRAFLELGAFHRGALVRMDRGWRGAHIIGTGHCAEHYDEPRERYHIIETVLNPIYASSGSMRTLYELRDKVSGDFFLWSRPHLRRGRSSGAFKRS